MGDTILLQSYGHNSAEIHRPYLVAKEPVFLVPQIAYSGCHLLGIIRRQKTLSSLRLCFACSGSCHSLGVPILIWVPLRGWPNTSPRLYGHNFAETHSPYFGQSSLRLSLLVQEAVIWYFNFGWVCLHAWATQCFCKAPLCKNR